MTSQVILQPLHALAVERRVRTVARPLRLRLSWVCSFEAMIILSLFGGVRSGDVPLGLPVDPTWVFAGLSFAVGLQLLLGGLRFTHKSVSLVFLGSLFCGIVVVSLAYTVGRVYATDKALLVATLNLWMLVAGALVFAQSPVRAVRLASLLFWLGASIGLLTIGISLRGGGGFVSIFGAAYLSISRILGYGAILGIAYLVFVGPRARAKILTFCALGIILIAMLVAGGRGPLIGATLAVLPLAIARLPRSGFKRTSKRPISRLIAVALLGALVVAPFLAIGPARTLDRIAVLFDTPNFGASGFARLEFYTDAVDQWRARPWLGNGVGSWPILAGFGDVRGYPHNIFLEVGAEQGILGLCLLLLLLGYASFTLGPWRRLRASPTLLTIFMLLTYALANALVSGDIPDNRVLFLLLGMCAIRESGPDMWLESRS